MLSARAATACSAAASTAAGLALAGRIEMSVPACLVLVLVARAAALAAAPDRGSFDLASRLGLAVPAWALVAWVGMARAGSAWLADIRGAHAVAGISLFHGEPIAVAASWLALAGGIVAFAGSLRTGRDVLPGWPAAPAEALALVVQFWLLVTLFAGTQLRGAADLLPWAVAAMVAGGLVWLVRDRARPWHPRSAVAVTVVAAALAMVAS